LVFFITPSGSAERHRGVEHDQRPLHITVTKLSRQLVNGFMTWNGLTTIGANQLRTETSIETRAAQGGDSDITVLSPIRETGMGEVHTRAAPR
jgi:hypothetical protein